MKRILFAILLAMVVSLLAVALWPREPRKPKPPEAVSTQTPLPQTQTQTATHNHEAKDRVPAHFTTTPPASELRGTLAPEGFTGNVRLAYQAAKDIPETLAQLPCYCHCDRGHGHKSLYSCFEDDHGANCGICIGEAIMAHNLKRQGLTPAAIRDRIIAAYGEE